VVKYLLLGLFTPIVSLLAGVGVVGIALSWFVVPDRNLFVENFMSINMMVLFLAMFLATKPVPVNVMNPSASFTVAVPGVTDVTLGEGLLIVNVSSDEVPPPGAGFETEIVASTALSKSSLVTAMVS
jgi:hypothetical protein